MNHDSPDLAAVRETLAGRTPPDDGALPRVWSRIGARLAADDRTVTRRPVRWLVPVGAATAVVGLALGAAVLVDPGGAGDGSVVPAAPPTGQGTAPLPLPAFPPPDDYEFDPAEDFLPWDTTISEGLLVEGDPVDLTAAVAELVAAAGNAPPPATVHPGQLVYVRSGTELREDWFDPDGMRLLVVRYRGVWFDGSDPADGAAAPGLHHPTPQWLADLPTDPEALLALLRDEASTAGSGPDTYLFKEVSGLLQAADLLLSPQVRAALYQALSIPDGVSAVELDADGTRLLALRHTEEYADGPGPVAAATELLVDPATGRVVGTRTLAYPSGDAAPVIGVSVWTQAVVDEVGQTG